MRRGACLQRHEDAVQRVARACGFGNLNTMRRVFISNLGRTTTTTGRAFEVRIRMRIRTEKATSATRPRLCRNRGLSYGTQFPMIDP